MAIKVLFSKLPFDVSEYRIDSLEKSVGAQWRIGLQRGSDLKQYGQSLLGRNLIERLVNEHCSSCTDLFINDWGKPMLTTAEYFSIAHSENIVVAAFSKTCPVGIDVECVRSIEVNDYTDYFTAGEMASFAGFAGQYNFYSSWTAKEAIAKAIGEGMNIDFRQMAPIENGLYEYRAEKWKTDSVKIGADIVCKLAVQYACQDQEFEVNFINWTSLLVK